MPQKFSLLESFDPSSVTLGGNASKNGSGLIRTGARIRMLCEQRRDADCRALAEVLQSAIETVDYQQATYGNWLQGYVSTFPVLPVASKVASALRAMVWYIAILLIAMEIDNAKDVAQPWCNTDIAAKTTELQSSAIANLCTWARIIARCSSEGDVLINTETRLALPFISLFGNPTLIVELLNKAISRSIELHQSGNMAVADQPYGPAGILGRSESIRPLIECLLGLEKTVAGRCAVRPLFDNLVRQYGDIIHA